jgi:hypothetical protein
MTPGQVQALRGAVADMLAQRGHSNGEFLRQIRDGEQDDGPFMTGAIVGWRMGVAVEGEKSQ